MPKITKLFAREILDSRGNPTIEADCVLDNGILGRATVPSGASTGEHEALELRDGGKRYMGKGVQKAVNNVNNIISKAIKGMNSFEQTKIDNKLIHLDGTSNKSKLGANAILACSLAIARASANAKKEPLYYYLGTKNANVLPVPLMNIINGGAHADNNLDFQEYMIVPVGANCFKDALRIGVEVYHSLKLIIKQKGHATTIGDEGGFAPDFSSVDDILDTILQAIEHAGYKAGKDVFLALDTASSELYDGKEYHFRKSRFPSKNSAEMVELFSEIVKKYPVVSIEDGLAENDWHGWKELTKKLGDSIQLVGDDIFVTNKKFLQKGITEKAANSILIKLNQIGTLTETLEVINIAKKAGYSFVISHRSGETEEAFISHLAVATNSGQIKTGASARAERTAKYNELIRIEEVLGKKAQFLGFDTFKK